MDFEILTFMIFYNYVLWVTFWNKFVALKKIQKLTRSFYINMYNQLYNLALSISLLETTKIYRSQLHLIGWFVKKMDALRVWIRPGARRVRGGTSKGSPLTWGMFWESVICLIKIIKLGWKLEDGPTLLTGTCIYTSISNV